MAKFTKLTRRQQRQEMAKVNKKVLTKLLNNTSREELTDDMIKENIICDSIQKLRNIVENFKTRCDKGSHNNSKKSSKSLPSWITRKPDFKSILSINSIPCTLKGNEVAWFKNDMDDMEDDTYADLYNENNFLLLGKELEKFSSYVALESHEQLARRDLINKIRSHVNGLWKNQFSVMSFGSNSVGLETFLSDIDLSLIDAPISSLQNSVVVNINQTLSPVDVNPVGENNLLSTNDDRNSIDNDSDILDWSIDVSKDLSILPSMGFNESNANTGSVLSSQPLPQVDVTVENNRVSSKDNDRITSSTNTGMDGYYQELYNLDNNDDSDDNCSASQSDDVDNNLLDHHESSVINEESNSDNSYEDVSEVDEEADSDGFNDNQGLQLDDSLDNSNNVTLDSTVNAVSGLRNTNTSLVHSNRHEFHDYSNRVDGTQSLFQSNDNRINPNAPLENNDDDDIQSEDSGKLSEYDFNFNVISDSSINQQYKENGPIKEDPEMIDLFQSNARFLPRQHQQMSRSQHDSQYSKTLAARKRLHKLHHTIKVILLILFLL